MGRKLSSPQRQTSVLLKAESPGWAQCPVAARSPCFAPWDVCNQRESPAQITVFNQSGRKMICTSLSLQHIPATVILHAYYLCQSCQGHDERNWEPSRSRHSGGCRVVEPRQPDSVCAGTLLWPPGCCWHHLMYIFKYKTSPFTSEIVFNGLSNTKGQLLSPKENIERTLCSFFFFTAWVRGSWSCCHVWPWSAQWRQSYFVQWDYMTAVGNGCKLSLLIFSWDLLTKNSILTKNRRMVCVRAKVKHNAENLMLSSHCWRFNFHSLFQENIHTINAKQQESKIYNKAGKDGLKWNIARP